MCILRSVFVLWMKMWFFWLFLFITNTTTHKTHTMCSVQQPSRNFLEISHLSNSLHHQNTNSNKWMSINKYEYCCFSFVLVITAHHHITLRPKITRNNNVTHIHTRTHPYTHTHTRIHVHTHIYAHASIPICLHYAWCLHLLCVVCCICVCTTLLHVYSDCDCM